MGPGVGAQRRGACARRMSDECHHDCTGPPGESPPSPRPEPLVAVVWCVCVPRYPFQSCSDCEVRHSYSPTTTANHEFGVLPCRGAALLGMTLHMYKCHQQTTAPGPMNLTTKQQDTHCMHVCPTAPHRSSPCIPERHGGGGGEGQCRGGGSRVVVPFLTACVGQT